MFLRPSTLLVDLLRLLPLPRVDPLTMRSINFAVRTTAASLTALYIALFLQLEDPQWAAVTVWVVGQPMRGMALSKSYYRILGTIAGSIMAVGLTALFAQHGALFILHFALWIALCTFVSTLLRNFKAYGTVLAGYTCGIIAFAAYGRPEDIFDITVARVSCILLGIACEVVFAAIFAKSAGPQPALLARLRNIASDTAAFAADAIDGSSKSKNNDRGQRILRDIVALDTTISYAAAEDGNLRRKAGALRQIIVSIMNSVSAAQALGRHIARGGMVSPAMAVKLDEARIILGRVTGEGGLPDIIPPALPQAAIIDARTYFISSRLVDMFTAFGFALRQIEDFFRGRPMKGRADLSWHRDYHAAAINALRAFIAVMCAGLFWYLSGWSHGPNFTRIVAVVCALYATRDNPVIGSLTFFNGALLAGIASAFCSLVLLPGISGFPLLVLVTAPFMISAGLLMVRPKTAGLAAAFNIYFISLLGISNTTRLPFIDFLNSLVPLLCGVGISVIVFMVFFPVNLTQRRAGIQRAVLRDIGRLASPRDRTPETRWCSRMADRLALLSAIGPPGNGNPLMERVISALEIGIQTIRLRQIFCNHALPDRCHAPMEKSLGALSRIAHMDITPEPGSRHWQFWPMGQPAESTPQDLYETLMENAALLKDFLAGEPGMALSPETRLRLLEAIAAHGEIAEILLVHYLDRPRQTAPTPAPPKADY